MLIMSWLACRGSPPSTLNNYNDENIGMKILNMVSNTMENTKFFARAYHAVYSLVFTKFQQGWYLHII